MTQLRIMSFNLAGNSDARPDPNNNWIQRLPLAVDVIERHAPDLIGFQEMRGGNWTDLENHLPAYHRIRGFAYGNNPDISNYTSIFWRADRFELIDQGGFYLAPDPRERVKAWDASEPRCASWVELRITNGGPTPLLFVNTHLDHRGPEARRRGAQVVIDQIQAIRDAGQPVFMTGDFNCEPDSEPYTLFTAAGYHDLYRAAGETDGPDVYSFHAFTGKHVEERERDRIDWILGRPGESRIDASAAAILRDGKPPIFPSDHFPVTADCTLSGS